MAGKVPTPEEFEKALKEYGVKHVLYRNWKTRSNYKWGSSFNTGLAAVLVHFTATASATGDAAWDKGGAPTLYWCSESYSDASIANALIARDGTAIIMSYGPAWHSGNGGPWPAIGVKSANQNAISALYGIEIDAPGRSDSKSDINDAQRETTARLVAVLQDLCGWPKDGSRIVTHQAWTDGSFGVNPNGPSPNKGRKGDTLHDAWGEWPGPKDDKHITGFKASRMNPAYWVNEVSKYSKSLGGSVGQPMWEGVVPSREKANKCRTDGGECKDCYHLTARLNDLGYKTDGFKAKGKESQKRAPYPSKAMDKWRDDRGWSGDAFSKKAQAKLFDGADVP
jgi:hypothetical protein